METLTENLSTRDLSTYCENFSYTEHTEFFDVTQEDIEKFPDHLGPDLITKTEDEQKQLKGLNDRFARYLERVQELEKKIKIQEVTITKLRKRQVSNLAERYEEELVTLRKEESLLKSKLATYVLEHNHHKYNAEKYQCQYKKELAYREELEKTICFLKSELIKAGRIQIQTQQDKNSTLREIKFLKEVHEKEVQELQSQLSDVSITVTATEQNIDISGMIEDLRAEYEGKISTYKRYTTELWQQRIDKINKQLEEHKITVRDLRTKMKAEEVKMEQIQSTYETLTMTHEKTQQINMDTTDELKQEIESLKRDKEEIMKKEKINFIKYTELLSVKIALVREIGTYRELLENSEERLDARRGHVDSFDGEDHLTNMTEHEEIEFPELVLDDDDSVALHASPEAMRELEEINHEDNADSFDAVENNGEEN